MLTADGWREAWRSVDGQGVDGYFAKRIAASPADEADSARKRHAETNFGRTPAFVAIIFD